MKFLKFYFAIIATYDCKIKFQVMMCIFIFSVKTTAIDFKPEMYYFDREWFAVKISKTYGEIMKS